MLYRETIAFVCEDLTKHEHILWTKWRLDLRWRRNTNCDYFLTKSIEVYEIWMHEACQSLARMTCKSGLKIYFLWWYLSPLGQWETTVHSVSISSPLIEESAQKGVAHHRACRIEFRQGHLLTVRIFISLHLSEHVFGLYFNPLNPELNPICYLLALLGAHHFLHVSRIRVKILTFRLLMSFIYGAPILDVSRSHTTTQHSR